MPRATITLKEGRSYSAKGERFFNGAPKVITDQKVIDYCKTTRGFSVKEHEVILREVEEEPEGALPEVLKGDESTTDSQEPADDKLRDQQLASLIGDKLRVHQLAAQLGLTSSDLVAQLQAWGYAVTSHANALSAEQVEAVTDRYLEAGAAADAAE